MKMKGVIKWYKEDKKYGYITGADDESYYFTILDCININETFKEGDQVLFDPIFGEIDSASKVEKVTINEE